MDENQPIQAVSRTLNLLELLAREGGMGVTELAAAAGLNKATVFRQLQTLVALGYAYKSRDNEKYYLTLKLAELGGRLLEQLDVRKALRPYLEQLAADTGETVHLVQLEERDIVYIDKVEPAVNSLRMVSRVGMRQPLYCTAVGKAILAEFSDEEIRRYWETSEIRPLTPHTITRWEAFMEEIRTTRRRGFALDLEENEEGIRCVAVSLNYAPGTPPHAVSISAPASRASLEALEKMAPLLLGIKARLHG